MELPGIGNSKSGTQNLLGSLFIVCMHGLLWLVEQVRSPVSVLPASSWGLSLFFSLWLSHLSAKYTDIAPPPAGERRAINNKVGVPPGTRVLWDRGHWWQPRSVNLLLCWLPGLVSADPCVLAHRMHVMPARAYNMGQEAHCACGPWQSWGSCFSENWLQSHVAHSREAHWKVCIYKVGIMIELTA